MSWMVHNEWYERVYRKSVLQYSCTRATLMRSSTVQHMVQLFVISRDMNGAAVRYGTATGMVSAGWSSSPHRPHRPPQDIAQVFDADYCGCIRILSTCIRMLPYTDRRMQNSTKFQYKTSNSSLLLLSAHRRVPVHILYIRLPGHCIHTVVVGYSYIVTSTSKCVMRSMIVGWKRR